MAIYGVSTYGAPSNYGAPGTGTFTTTLGIQQVGYDRLFLNWTPPTGTWSDIALVRSSYGFPATLTDGVELFRTTFAAAPVSFMDGLATILQPGRFYYYTLFVYSTGDTIWVPIAYVFAPVVQNHAFGDRMWAEIPEFYRWEDYAQRGQADSGPLYRYLALLGYQTDRMKTDLDTLRNVYNIDLVSGGLLPTIAESFGTKYEPSLGMRVSRNVVKNVAYLSKIKGTRPGIEGTASVYTGFGADARIGPNLLLHKNNSGWKEAGSVGGWEVTQNCTLSQVDSGTLAPAVAGTGSLKLTHSGAATAIAQSGSFASGSAIPVLASTQYAVAAYVQHGGTSTNASVGITWYTAAGAVISSTDGTASATSAAWVQRTHAATSPANAAWAVMRVTFASSGTQINYVGAAQFERAAAPTTWQSARQVNVYLAPERTNLVTNPSLETNATGWAAGANTTAARSTAQFLHGTASLSLTATGAGTTSALTNTTMTVEQFQTYAASAYFRPGTTARSVRISITWKLGGATLSTSTGTSVTEVAATWTRASLVASAPATADNAVVTVEVLANAAAEVHYVDGVLLEESSFVRTYFDASFLLASDYAWQGTTHNSRSFYYPNRAIKDERLLAVLDGYVPEGLDYATFYTDVVPASSV